MLIADLSGSAPWSATQTCPPQDWSHLVPCATLCGRLLLLGYLSQVPQWCFRYTFYKVCESLQHIHTHISCQNPHFWQEGTHHQLLLQTVFGLVWYRHLWTEYCGVVITYISTHRWTWETFRLHKHKHLTMHFGQSEIVKCAPGCSAYTVNSLRLDAKVA